MSSRQRIEKAMNFEKVDHIPTLGGWLTSSPQYCHFAGLTEQEFWKDPEAGAMKAYQNLQVDGLIGVFIPPTPDRYRGLTAEVVEKINAEFPTPEAVLEYVEALPEPEKVCDEFDEDQCYREIAQDMVQHQEKAGEIVWMPGRWEAVGTFMWYCRFGYMSYLSALGLYPDRMRKLFEHSAETARLTNQVLAKVYDEHDFCKLLLTGQDICGQSGPMVSIAFLEEVYFPLAKVAAQPLIDAGFKLIWHSDGNVLPILDMVIDLGVAGFQGFQWETGTTIEKVAARRTLSGEPFVFMTAMSVTKTLPFGTPDDVRAEIDHCIEVTGGRGLFLLPSNTINPDAKMENIRTAYEYARQAQLP